MKKFLGQLKTYMAAFFRFFKGAELDELREEAAKLITLFEAVKMTSEGMEVDYAIISSASRIDDKVYNAFLKALEALRFSSETMEKATDKREFVKLLGEALQKRYRDRDVRLGIYHMLTMRALQSLFPKVPGWALSIAVAWGYGELKQARDKKPKGDG